MKNEISEKLNEIAETTFTKFDALQERVEKIEALAERPKAANDPVAGSIQTKAIEHFLRTGNTEKLRETKSMTISSDDSGGYTHIAELGNEIIAAVGEINPVLRECTQVTIDANEYNQIFTTTRTGTARAAESGTRSESTTANFVRTDIPLYDLYSYPKITNELLNSSQFNLDAWIRQDVAEAFDEALGTEFVTGDGSSKSVGLLNSMSSNTLDGSPDLPWGSLHFVSGQSSPEAITYAALLDVISALPVRYKLGGNARWFMSTSAIEAVRNLLDNNNLPIWRQDFGVAGAPMVLLGYPVVEVPQLDGQTYRVLFGDMKKAYAFVSHSKGLGVIVDQITAPGFTKFYASLQCAGGVMDSRAMVALRA